MTTTMLPCPFCGSNDIDPTGWQNSEGVEGPVCNNCTASIGTVGRTTEANIAAWNERAGATLSPTPREIVGYRWRFEDQPDKWHVQKKIPYWYFPSQSDVILQPLYAE